jgi:hypothetical protein
MAAKWYLQNEKKENVGLGDSIDHLFLPITLSANSQLLYSPQSKEQLFYPEAPVGVSHKHQWASFTNSEISSWKLWAANINIKCTNMLILLWAPKDA